MRKRVKIVDSSNVSREAIVYRVDITMGGTIVISYYDIENNNTNSFSEIIYRDGTWCKTPYHLKWEEYVFRPYNEEISNEIINELEVIEELVPKIKPLKQEKAIPKEPKEIVNLVMYANEDESTVNLKPELEEYKYNLDILTSFFDKGFIDINNQKQIFKRIDISNQDKQDIINYMLRYYFKDNKLDISNTSSFSVKTTSGVNYLVNLSSCANSSLFFQVLNASSIEIDRSTSNIGINRVYNNYLDMALNYVIPMEIFISNNRTR